MKEPSGLGPLRREIMLQINERLYIQGMIPKALYDQIKWKLSEPIVSPPPG